MLQGTLRIKTTQNLQIAGIRDTPRADSYLAQLTKLFPAEIVSIYPVGKSLLKAGDLDVWWFALLCAVAIIVVRFIATTPVEGGRPQFVAVAASLISFLLWIVALGDWFLPGSPPMHAAPITAAFALIWTWVAPQIVSRFEWPTPKDGRNPMTLRLFPLLALVLLSACATDRPLAFNGCTVFDKFRIGVGATPGGRDRPEAGNVRFDTPHNLQEVFANSISRTRSRDVGSNLNYLVLSGGGQWGAFGAGFLKGWSDLGTGVDARPARFDVVTGISTGALQSTFAFLGMPGDDGLVDAYSITDERQLLNRHGAAFFISHASLADTSPASDYVRVRVRPLIDKVAAPENAGRTLLVGTVDALDGELYAIDLTRIARELTGQQREDCYVGALMASAAVPIVFRQVTVGGTPYFDGGVRKSVFVTQVQNAAGEALTAQRQAGTIYILINGDPVAGKIATLPAKLLPSLNRLRSIVFNQVELSSIFETSRTFPGMSTMIATASGNPCNAAADEDGEIFSPKVMTCLRQDGYARWKSGVPWKRYPVR